MRRSLNVSMRRFGGKKDPLSSISVFLLASSSTKAGCLTTLHARNVEGRMAEDGTEVRSKILERDGIVGCMVQVFLGI